MNATVSCRWLIALSLISIFAVMAATPAPSRSAAGSGPVGSRPSGSHETSKPAKPRGTNPADTVRPPDLPGRPPVPRERAQALEERLRRGQMDEPIAQGRISDRLEQFHRGSAEGSTGETPPEQSAQGIVPE